MILNLERLLGMFEDVKHCPVCYRNSVGTPITCFVFVPSIPGTSCQGLADKCRVTGGFVYTES